MLEFREVTEPYPGLRPFEPWEGEIFFGREAHTDRLLEILQQQHFLAVIGPSGSGKSSLVRAGLLPALPLGSIGTGSDWRMAIMRPGNRPMQRLASALLSEKTLGLELVGPERIPKNDQEITADVAVVEAEFKRGPFGLVDLVTDARKKGDAGEPFNLLVLVDQFEEIFTYVDAGTSQADESEAFINLLLESRNAKDGRIFIVLTMRTDFLGNCVRFLDLPDAINRSQYLTPRLTREQTELAIRGPARVFGGDVEPPLVTELINTLGNDPDQLPILQHALARMWDFSKRRNGASPKINWDDFKEVGGLRKALSKHADQILASLGPDNKPIAEVLFRAITEQRNGEAGSQAVRRPQSLKQIGDWSRRNWKDFEPTVKAFAQEGVNFLNFNRTLNEETVVDISHEALIRQWDTLRGWVESEGQRAREYRRWQERASDNANGAAFLLEGVPLARAAEWLAENEAGGARTNWRPDAQWASRYCSAEKITDGQSVTSQPLANFESVYTFIKQSERIAKAKEEAREQARLLEEKRERQRLEAERVAAEKVAEAERLRADAETRERVAAEKVAEAERSRRDEAIKSASRFKKFTIVLGFLFLSAVGLGYLAYRSQIKASDREITASAAGYWHPFTFESQLDATELNALLKLVRDRTSVKQRFIEQALSDPQLARRFIVKPAPITEAAIGVSPLVQREALEQIRRSRATTSSDATRTASALILVELDDPNSFDAVVGAIKSTTNSDQLSALGQGLAAVAGKVSDTQAKAVTDTLLAAIKGATNSDQLSALGQGLAAVARKVSDNQAKAVADTLLAAIKGATNSDQLFALGDGLAAVAGKVPDTQANAIANTLLAAIKGATNSDQLSALGQGLTAVAGKVSDTQANAIANTLLAAIKGATNSDQLSALGRGLAAVAGKDSDTQAKAVTDTLLAAIKGATNSDQLSALGQGLAAVAGKVSDTQAKAVTDNILAAIKGTTNSDQLFALGQGLAAVAGKVSDTQAKAVTNTLLAAIKGATNSDQLSALGQGLAAVAGRLSDTQAKAVTDTLLAAIKGTTNSDQLSALGQGLAAVAGRLSDTQAKAVTDTLLAAIKGATNSDQLSALGQGLAAVAGKVSDTQAKAVTDTLLAAIKGATGIDQPSALGQGLAAVAGRLSDTQAKAVTDTLLAAIKGTTNSDQLSALGQGLAAVAGRLSDTQANAIANTLLAAIKDTTDGNQLSALGQGLSAVAGRLSDTQSKSLASALFSSIKVSANGIQLPALGQGLAAAAGRAKVDESLAKQLIESLKYPGLPRKEIVASIRKDFKDAPPEKDGFWAFILWAQKKFPDLDLNSPPP